MRQFPTDIKGDDFHDVSILNPGYRYPGLGLEGKLDSGTGSDFDFFHGFVIADLPFQNLF